MDENAEESKFNEEDIETILLRRTTTITLEVNTGFFIFIIFYGVFSFPCISLFDSLTSL